MNKNDANRKRKHFVSLRLDDREYNKLKEWSAATNRTMSDYLRELLEDNQPKIISVMIFVVAFSIGVLLNNMSKPISDVIFFTLLADIILLFIKNKDERRIKYEVH